MRKSFVILIAIISFALGLASQSLIVGGNDPNDVFPEYNSMAPVVERTSFHKEKDRTIYRFPDNWKSESSEFVFFFT